MAKDISAVGAKIEFWNFGVGNFTVSEFSDEGTPFDAPDIDASENKKNLNGIMISSRTPSVYPFSVTVIPGSIADQMLTRLLQHSSIQPGGVAEIGNLYGQVIITIPETHDEGSNVAAGDQIASGARAYTYTNCRIKSGPTGPTTSSEGRLGSRTFTFEAEGFKPWTGGSTSFVQTQNLV